MIYMSHKRPSWLARAKKAVESTYQEVTQHITRTSPTSSKENKEELAMQKEKEHLEQLAQAQAQKTQYVQTTVYQSVLFRV